MNASRTAREHARAELTSSIKHEARRQLVDVGPNALSLRAVARALGMVSSALYRYFPSRDELLTALIVDAYTSLGEHAENAVAAQSAPVEQWRAGCRAVRGWARAHPQEYALVYGSPVPGYSAPQATIAPAGKVALALFGPVRTGYAAGNVRSSHAVMSDDLRVQLGDLATALATDLPDDVLARTLTAWTQLFGMISFELFGHLVGSVDPSDEFFEHAVDQMAGFIGFDDASSGS